MLKKFIIVFSLNFIFISNIQAQDVNKEQIYNKLTYIFNYDMLGVTIPFFESKVGILKRIDYDGRQYEIGPCIIKVKGEESVESIKLEGISKICNFNASNILEKNYKIDIYKLKHSDIIKPGKSYNVIFECLFLCGSSGIGELIFSTSLGTPKENKVITILTPINKGNTFSRKKVDELASIISQKERNTGRTKNDSFNEKGEYNQLAYEIFKDLHIINIAISKYEMFRYFH
jgi:hypothetical protein